jgi:hypothetical protein
MDKLHNPITLAKSADKRTVAAIVSKARGDNATMTVTQFEPLVLRASAGYSELIAAVKRAPHTQEAFQKRAMMARFYAMDYMADVDAGKVKEHRGADGSIVIPPMTEETRKHYASLLAGAKPDAKSLKEGQVRCTETQWQRKSTLRTWWSRLLGAAGIKTIEKRGGSRVKEGKAKVAKGVKSTTDKVDSRTNRLPARNEQGGFAMPAIVKVQAPAEAAAYYTAMATTLVKFTSVNFKSKASAPFDKLVQKFHRDVMALAKKCK